MTQGIFNLSPQAYHSDPCPEPSLSNSILKTLIAQTPAHARLEHPRLNPNYSPKVEDKFDLGTAAHAYLLEGMDRVEVVEADDWRTKDARARRDAARLAFKVPMLAHQYGEMLLMVAAAKAYISRTPLLNMVFSSGKPEQTAVWRDEHQIWCRSMIDWLTDDRSYIIDYKTTSELNPDGFIRSMPSKGYDTQEVFYRRGMAVLGASPKFLFLVQEDSPPFACYLVDSGPSMQALGESKVKRGVDRWALCMKTEKWPEYAPLEGVYTASAPAWALINEEVLHP